MGMVAILVSGYLAGDGLDSGRVAPLQSTLGGLEPESVREEEKGEVRTSLSTHHDNVMLFKAFRKFGHVTPVCGLLVGNGHIWDSDLHGLQVPRQWGNSDLGFQKLHPLQSLPEQSRNIDGLEGRSWFLQNAVNEMHSSVLEGKSPTILSLSHQG